MTNHDGASTKVQFWFDPGCPWCWVTSRWLADEVAPRRDLDVEWLPISLLFKNDPEPGTDFHRAARWTTDLMRVVASMREGGEAHRVGDYYRVVGERIHHEGDRHFDPAEIVTGLGIAPEHAAAFHDDSWDAWIRKTHDDGLSLTGDDVGTPIIAFTGDDGERVGLFGPVISRKPTGAEALRLWDGVVAMASTQGFWELKRTRTEGPRLPA